MTIYEKKKQYELYVLNAQNDPLPLGYQIENRERRVEREEQKEEGKSKTEREKENDPEDSIRPVDPIVFDRTRVGFHRNPTSSIKNRSDIAGLLSDPIRISADSVQFRPNPDRNPTKTLSDPTDIICVRSDPIRPNRPGNLSLLFQFDLHWTCWCCLTCWCFWKEKKMRYTQGESDIKMISLSGWTYKESKQGMKCMLYTNEGVISNWLHRLIGADHECKRYFDRTQTNDIILGGRAEIKELSISYTNERPIEESNYAEN
jgi:hypothetical protein